VLAIAPPFDDYFIDKNITLYKLSGNHVFNKYLRYFTYHPLREPFLVLRGNSGNHCDCVTNADLEVSLRAKSAAERQAACQLRRNGGAGG
jgi:hypothetical protein